MTDLLNSKEPITLEQLRENFREHDFSTTPVRDPSEYNEKELRLYNKVLKYFNSEWNEVGKSLGLTHPSSYHTKDFPPKLLRERTQRIVADLVVKLRYDKKAFANVFFKIIIPTLFVRRKNPDECLHNTMNALMHTVDMKTIAEISEKYSCDEDFSSKPLNYPKLDHQRRWNHTRSKVRIVSAEETEKTIQIADTADIERVTETKLKIDYLRSKVSEQENMIIDLLLKEYTQTQIAERLGIAQSTVSKKLKKIQKILSEPE